MHSTHQLPGMRITLDELHPGEQDELFCVHVAHFEWESRRVAACLDASDVAYAEEDAPGGHSTAYFVGAGAAQRALRALEYAGLRPSPHGQDAPHG